MFPLLSVDEIKLFLPEIRKEKVSKRARKKDGFLTVYLNEGIRGVEARNYPNKNHSYLVERENFLRRTLIQFIKEPTKRRYLSLIAWAFIPKYPYEENLKYFGT